MESEEGGGRGRTIAVGIALVAVLLLLHLALGSALDAGLILASLPVAFVGSIVALLISGETWNVSSLVGLIGLFGIAVQNGLVLVTQTRSLVAEGRSFESAGRGAGIGRLPPQIMYPPTATPRLLSTLPLPF